MKLRPLGEMELRFAKLIWECAPVGSGELVRRCVRNIGNVYLVIDGDAYLAPHDDLAAWPSRGIAPLPAGFEQ